MRVRYRLARDVRTGVRPRPTGFIAQPARVFFFFVSQVYTTRRRRLPAFSGPKTVRTRARVIAAACGKHGDDTALIQDRVMTPPPPILSRFQQ